MPALKAPTVEDLTAAAIKLVDAIVEHRSPNTTRISAAAKKAESETGPVIRAISIGDLVDTEQEVLRLRDLVADPVGTALKRQLRSVGQAIYDRVGSSDKLVEIGETIANTNPRQYGTRMSPLDSAWNGVGSGNDRWWS